MRILNPTQRRSMLSLALGLCVAAMGLVSAPADAQTSKAKKPAATKTRGVRAQTASLKKKRSVRSRRVKGQQAPASDRISEIQAALAKEGSYSGTPSGKWDQASAEAMKKFQAGHGLNPTGKLDALSLQKLGLGAPTAGVAAPYPAGASSEAVSETASPNATRPQ